MNPIIGLFLALALLQLVLGQYECLLPTSCDTSESDSCCLSNPTSDCLPLLPPLESVSPCYSSSEPFYESTYPFSPYPYCKQKCFKPKTCCQLKQKCLTKLCAKKQCLANKKSVLALSPAIPDFSSIPCQLGSFINGALSQSFNNVPSYLDC